MADAAFGRLRLALGNLACKILANPCQHNGEWADGGLAFDWKAACLNKQQNASLS
jgi:hypothetical protein